MRLVVLFTALLLVLPLISSAQEQGNLESTKAEIRKELEEEALKEELRREVERENHSKGQAIRNTALVSFGVGTSFTVNQYYNDRLTPALNAFVNLGYQFLSPLQANIRVNYFSGTASRFTDKLVLTDAPDGYTGSWIKRNSQKADLVITVDYTPFRIYLNNKNNQYLQPSLGLGLGVSATNDNYEVGETAWQTFSSEKINWNVSIPVNSSFTFRFSKLIGFNVSFDYRYHPAQLIFETPRITSETSDHIFGITAGLKIFITRWGGSNNAD